MIESSWFIVDLSSFSGGYRCVYMVGAIAFHGTTHGRKEIHRDRDIKRHTWGYKDTETHTKTYTETYNK